MTPDNLSAENYNSLRQVFSCIDNTTLEGSDTHNRVEQLCRRSMELVDAGRAIGPVAAVCVYPVFVQQARTLLQGSGIRVASVAGAFPAGQSPLSIKRAEVRYAVDQGADEIDMVISRGSLIEGDYNKVFDEIAAIRQETQARETQIDGKNAPHPHGDFGGLDARIENAHHRPEDPPAVHGEAG